MLLVELVVVDPVRQKMIQLERFQRSSAHSLKGISHLSYILLPIVSSFQHFRLHLHTLHKSVLCQKKDSL